MGLVVPDVEAGGYSSLSCDFSAWDAIREAAFEGYYPQSNGGAIIAATNNGANTTVAAGSNGGNIANVATWGGTYGGNGVLDLAANPTGLSPAFPASGQCLVATSAGWARIAYTGTSGSTLTGCTLVEGSGTVSTGGVVVLPAVKIPACTDYFANANVGIAATDNICIPAPDATNDKWALLGWDSSAVAHWTIGTASAYPVEPPAPVAGYVYHAGLYIPAALVSPWVNATLTSSSPACAKIFDTRVALTVLPLTTVTGYLEASTTSTNPMSISLGVGIWDVYLQAAISSTSTSSINYMELVLGTAAGSFSGPTVMLDNQSVASKYQPFSIRCIVTVTTAGTIVMVAGASAGTLSTYGGSYGSGLVTGMVAVKIG